MEQTWIIAQNGYGYHGVNAGTSDNPSHNGQGNGNGVGSNNADNNGNGNVKKTSTVIKQFVVDFTSETYKPLMEHEVNGLDYRYVNSGLDRLSVVVQGIENGSASLLDERNELHAYYHCDYLGTTDYLTSAVNSKVISWTDYNEWGEITHNAVLKCGQRELDLVKEYATHDFDSVLTMYYAKARFYDADNRRFTAVDPILDPSQYAIADYVSEVHQLNQYLYVMDNAVNGIDPLGLFMNYTVLYRGMPNMDKYYHDIKALQEELIRRGYNLKDSGTFDQKTENAVNKYKDRVMPGGNKGENRGKVGYSTWLKLGLKFSKPFGVFYGIPGLAFNWDIHQGKWYSPVDAIQRGFGYDDNLDTLFKACDYVRVKSVFKFNNKNWMIECWKGNYFNMGVGAEIGVYQNPGHVTIDYYERPYCLSTGFHNDAVENNNMLYMNFSLYYDDGFSKSLILSRITTKHWWLNGFRPFIECDSKNLTVRGEIFFLSKAMADAFRAGIKGDGDSRDDSKNFHTMEPAEARVDGEIWKYYKVTFTWGKV